MKPNVWGRLSISKILRDRASKKLKEKCFTLDLGPKVQYLIGRSSKADITFQENTISFNHGIIGINKKSNYYILDKNSSNGTYLLSENYQGKLEPNIEYLLSTGDKISFSFPSKNIFSQSCSLEKSPKKTDSNFYQLIFYGLDTEINSKTCYKTGSKELDEKYHFFEEIGKGSFAIVRRGVNIKTKEEVALKIIDRTKQSHYNHESKEESEIKVLNEVKLLKHLNHKGIAKYYDHHLTSEKLYIILEYCSGGELFDKIIEKKYNEENSKLLMFNLLNILRYLHEKNIMHRDLKPENILLFSKDSLTDIRLIDFGVAKKTRRGRKTFVGSLIYLAPEVYKRKNENEEQGDSYGKSADMWSVGVICYVLLSSLPPFEEYKMESDSFEVELEQILRFEDKFTKWDEISLEAKQFIRSLLKLKPEERLTAKESLDHAWLKDLTKVWKTNKRPKLLLNP